MPRGFLVKRSKRSSPASYRARGDDDNERQEAVNTPEGEEATGVLVPEDVRESWPGVPVEADPVEVGSDLDRYSHCSPVPDGSPRRADLSYSPIKPVGTELETSFFHRCLTSPAATEPFPLSTPVSSIERLLMNHHAPYGLPDVTFDLPAHHRYPPLLQHATKRGYVEPEREAKPAIKKPKANRKLSFEDEVTTSPVLGLRIKKEDPGDVRPVGACSGKKPLGEFICQLCREEYLDPVSLAQHKCSRIVRVEYRCPECDKVFSCPANLASHRRWHKPRPVNNTGEAQGARKSQPETGRVHERTSVEGKENASALRVNSSPRLEPFDLRYRTPEKCLDLHVRAADSPGVLLGPDGAASPFLPAPGPGEEMYECRFCSKRFRRHAYLRKHLAAHEIVKASPYRQIDTGQVPLPCLLCGALFPSAEIRDKHRLWHAMRDEILSTSPPGKSSALLPDLTGAEQQIFTCKHCPSTFFSSPGLTRHINKSHPTETRQVMLLQMAVSPGC